MSSSTPSPAFRGRNSGRCGSSRRSSAPTPREPGINYEKIHAVKDDKVRTVRIDQKYRAVILHPAEGDVYVLVWVDNHDEAMDWAGKRRFEVNPVTGSLQVFSVSEAEEAVAPKKKTAKPGLLDTYDDDVMLSFGVPEALLPAVRAVKTQDALLALVKHLPAEAAEALTWLGEGDSLEEVRAAVTITPVKETVNTEDLGTALENPDTKRRFVTIKSQDDLTSILNAPLAKWRVFLHPSQDRLVKQEVQWTGPSAWAAQARARPWWPCTGPGTWLGRYSRRRPTASCSRRLRRTWPRASSRTSAACAATRWIVSRSSTCTPGPCGS